MASSSLVTPDVETSLDMYGNSDLRNHSNRNSGGMVALIRLFRLLHSWIWSEMWVALFCLLDLVKSLRRMRMSGLMMVIEILEQYLWPFLQACTTLLNLLNTQRISGQNWIEPLSSTMRIIIAIWREHPTSQELFIQNYRHKFYLMKLFKMNKKQNLPHSQFELEKISLEWLLLLMQHKFMRSMISHIMIWLIKKKTYESFLLKKNSPSILCKHSPMILLF